MKIEILKENLEKVNDPRRQWGNLRHKLWEVATIALLSTICLGEDYDDMEAFGKEREGILKELGLELENGVPSSDTYERVIGAVKAEELRKYLNASLEIIREIRGVIPIDGKTVRGSGDKSSALHVISAFCAENQLVLGEIKSGKCKTEKNEIPELIRSIEVTGSIITTDSIGCYEKTVEAITEGGADYVIGLKKNQKTFHGMVESHFTTGVRAYDKTTTVEQGHGRIEVREYYLETDVSWLEGEYHWSGLRGVGMVRSCTKRGGKESTVTALLHYKP
jgi:hypothetical protein